MLFDCNIPAGAGLAPMAGVTDAAARLLSFEQGASWAVSEMLSAKGFVYSNGRSEAIRELLFRFPGEGTCGLQLFGREPEFVAEAARRLEGAGFSFIDLNFGCPAPKITGNGEGSALMKEPVQIAKVVRAAADAVKFPVTVKIRSGWNPESVNAVEVAKICEDAGAKAIAVHARTRSQFYGGQADWSVIAAVKRAVKIPVFGNGDVRSGADAVRMLHETGCDRVIVGRAAEGNPWIFREIRAALTGEAYSPPAFAERMATALRHLDLAVVLYGEKKGVLEMRKHVAWYITGVPGAAKLREGVNGVCEAEEVRELLMRYAGLGNRSPSVSV
ncbi:MAG: tRNA dihydrouridine synthase DusB [Clostridiales bacterium]|jgi:tRNA-dihydrouridine synthase B|nr:tRNA dihydrouridine synthase DusB [Clostridiales bacterium]OPZ68638.1 MAG: tRNA-dihydrouridine synthase C [Firmicutes bacterium ADurb.Bin467]